MTPQEQLITAARAEIGYHEKGDNITKYAEGNIDNEIYGWELQGSAWCDVFFDILMCKVFGTLKGMRMTYQYNEKTGHYIASAACSESANRYKSNGAFYSTPAPGDQIFFYSGGGINHTGIVETVGDNTITTIEGNYSDSVCRNVYKLPDSRIAGYGRPNWALAESNDEDFPESSATDYPDVVNPFIPTIRTMSGIYPILTIELQDFFFREVESLQALLNLRGFKVDVDGFFGPKTENAVKLAQAKYRVAIDGQAGADTITALQKDKRQ